MRFNGKKIFNIFCLMSLSQFVFANNLNSNFTIQAQIQAACSIKIDDFNFGSIQYKSDKVVLSSLNVTCNKGVIAIGTISKGNSDSFNRFMLEPNPESDKLNYLIQVPGGSSIGDGTNGTITLSINGTGFQTTQWISGIVLRNQYLKPGNYSDSLVFTLSY